jgi:hypothetical protein
MLAIGCGYPDGNDFDRLRFDPAFKVTRTMPSRTSVSFSVASELA